MNLQLRRRQSLALLTTLLLLACDPEPAQPPAAPQTPTISAPARLKVGAVGEATIEAQPRSTYSWSVSGAEIISGATSTKLEFRSASPGPVGLTVTVTNQAGATSAPAQATVASFTTLTSIMSSDVTGSPAQGVTEHDGADSVAYSYTPAQGASSTVIVEVNGAPAQSTGEVLLDQHRTIWAYGEPTAGTTFTDMIVVPNDPTIIPYPEFYSTKQAGTTRVADPYCAVISPTIAYPKSYLGEFPLPEPIGAPMGAELQRGVALKDYWALNTNNPSTNDGCSSDWHAAVEEAMRRVKRLGADHVSIYQNAYLKDANTLPLQFDCMGDATCASWAQIPDSEILWAAERAAALGLKLHLYVQVDVHDLARGSLPTAPTAEWLSSYFDAYETYIVHLGRLAEQAGIALMQVDWGVWWIDWSKPEYASVYRARMAEVAAEVRKVYSGKRALGVLTPWNSDDAALMAQTDVLLLELWMIQFQITAADNANLTPALLKQKYGEVIVSLGNVLGKHEKPTIFRFMAQSHRDYLQKGWIEDGFCSNGCEQQHLKIDFSVQAMAMQAQFEAVKEQTTFPVSGVDVNGYWFADVMLPKESFPNMSQSIRNKPAESVVFHWFKR